MIRFSLSSACRDRSTGVIGGPAPPSCRTSSASMLAPEARRESGLLRRPNPRGANDVQEVGIDPTKTRPSNEALLRRVRRATRPANQLGGRHRDWCSLEFQLPYGLYDASKISGPVMVRLGAEGESYPGIRKDDVNVAGRIVVADDIGAFGNPTSDSARTMVTPSSTELLIVVYAPAELGQSLLERVVTKERELRGITGGAKKPARRAEPKLVSHVSVADVTFLVDGFEESAAAR